MIELTRKEFEILEHATGLNSERPGYRAHYCADSKSEKTLRCLESKGYVKDKGNEGYVGTMFVCTLETVGALLDGDYTILPEEVIIYKADKDQRYNMQYFGCPHCAQAFTSQMSATICCNARAKSACDLCGTQVVDRGRVRHKLSCPKRDPFYGKEEVTLDECPHGVFYDDRYYEDVETLYDDLALAGEKDDVWATPAKPVPFEGISSELDSIIPEFWFGEYSDIGLLPEEAEKDWAEMVEKFNKKWLGHEPRVFEEDTKKKVLIKKEMYLQ